jgi:hypothetical protein
MVLKQIMESKTRSKESGHKPVLLIINGKTLRELIKEIEDSTPYARITRAETVVGLEVIVSDKIPDFQVIDDRPWTSQKF